MSVAWGSAQRWLAGWLAHSGWRLEGGFALSPTSGLSSWGGGQRESPGVRIAVPLDTTLFVFLRQVVGDNEQRLVVSFGNGA